MLFEKVLFRERETETKRERERERGRDGGRGRQRDREGGRERGGRKGGEGRRGERETSGSCNYPPGYLPSDPARGQSIVLGSPSILAYLKD